MTSLTPQPIETAPKDGSVILSDCGTVCYVVKDTWSRIPTGWYRCNLEGEIARCADEGYGVSREEPKTWLPGALEAFNKDEPIDSDEDDTE